MTPEEVEAAAGYLKDTMGKEGVQELISNLSKDRGSALAHTLASTVLAYQYHCPSSLLLLYLRFYLLMCLTEGNILVEDIKKMASQTEEDSEQKETAR